MTSEEAQEQARVERLRVADNKTGYFGVLLDKPSKPKPYLARVRRGGNQVHLGSFATAEEAALCVARSPEGQAAAERAAETPLTSEEARQQAQAEGLTLRVGNNKTGYTGVYPNFYRAGKPKPFQAQLRDSGKMVHLGSFATAEEAALCVARSPEGQVAAQRALAEPVPLTSEEARQQAQTEGLTLRVAENRTGYIGVSHLPGRSKPFQAQVSRAGKKVSLGYFAAAEEAALCVARSPEGQAAAKRAASSAAQQLSEEEGKGMVPPMPPGAFVKEEDMPLPLAVKEEGFVPPMPPDAFIKTETIVKDEEERSGSRPKRQRTR
eukprot:scaffold65766_cov51-Phaeocystis_antarctica.AAC.2